MKIKQEHITYMHAAIATIAERIPAHREFIVREGKAKDVEMRVRWDAMRAAGLGKWLCDTLYPYANDEHIDTALRHVMRELGMSNA